jgi:SnoaL-like domain
LLAALDARDVEAVLALAAPDIRYLFADGRRGEGADAMREAMTAFLGALRSASHDVVHEWHVDDTWIAEVTADYELRDHFRLSALPRVVIVRTGAEGMTEVRAYGAHEHPLAEHRTGEEGMVLGGRWIPSL